MSKTMKKVLVFVLALVIVLLMIFIIEIILPNNHTGETVVTPSSVTVKPSETPGGSTAPSPSPSPSPSLSPPPSDESTVTTEETPGGTKYTVTAPGLITYAVTADKAVFAYSRNNGIDVFKSVKDESEYLRISFIKDAKAADLAPSFLNSLINYNEFEQSGLNYIDGTKITGETVTADDGKTELTAWLVKTDKGVLAVVISLSMADKASQLPQLDKVLATLSLKV